jgi:hypothetical protein
VFLSFYSWGARSLEFVQSYSQQTDCSQYCVSLCCTKHCNKCLHLNIGLIMSKIIFNLKNLISAVMQYFLSHSKAELKAWCISEHLPYLQGAMTWNMESSSIAQSSQESSWHKLGLDLIQVMLLRAIFLYIYVFCYIQMQCLFFSPWLWNSLQCGCWPCHFTQTAWDKVKINLLVNNTF